MAHIAVSDLPMRVSVTRRSRQERATILTAAMATGYMSGLLVLLLSFNKLSCVTVSWPDLTKLLIITGHLAATLGGNNKIR